MNYTFKPIQTDDNSIEEISNVLQGTFPNTKKFTKEFVRWQYADNPIGPMIGYNAYLGDQLAAHYALMPLKACIDGKEEKGLLSLNTATHPNHRGKGLFTTLAQKSYDLAIDEGYSFVVGVANAQSTPGFLKKLDFQLAGSLEAKLGLGKVAYKDANDTFIFERIWDEASLHWRLSNPELPYHVKKGRVSVRTDNLFIQAVLRDFGEKQFVPNKNHPLGFRPIRLWIGINHNIDWKKSFYFDIPSRFRPSPLNLIFKDLSSKNRKFKSSEVRFSALDFDAY
ncbi:MULTISPECIES: GNAT family N-acetyltransferase [Aquimarina]|uniref:GNAT family N-acetyltransferase n=1 Tax=Aquimarina rubra TaxID=1920033 RepID=A0ABW5LI30_9FLAO